MLQVHRTSLQENFSGQDWWWTDTGHQIKHTTIATKKNSIPVKESEFCNRMPLFDVIFFLHPDKTAKQHTHNTVKTKQPAKERAHMLIRHQVPGEECD